MAKLDIAEKRLPQDGRHMIKYKPMAEKELDSAVSTVPTLYGEKVVMRCWTRKPPTGHDKLGFEPESLKKFERNI